jgi:septal ring factor EnvC (AmiA/AmiB activator)
MNEKPTKDFTTTEKLDNLLFRIEKIEGQLIQIENDRAREMRKIDALIAAINKLEAEMREIKGNLKR